MTIPEINQLRRNGNFIDAYNGCRELLRQFPDDRDARITMAWCLKSMSEISAREKDIDSMTLWLGELAELNLHEIGEHSMPNRFIWEIKTLLDSLRTEPDRLVNAAGRLMETLPGLHFLTPDKYYTILADSFLKIRGRQNSHWSGFRAFADWFGLDNLMAADYERIPLKTGKSIPSVAERLHSSYYKALVSEIEQGILDIPAIESFLQRLDRLNESHPEYQYTLYHKSLLLLAIGRKDDALQSIRPFVKRKQNEFWVWDVLSDTSDDKEIRLSCLCRALTCRTEPKFLGKVRLKTAKLMLDLGFSPNAKAELSQLFDVYRQNGWNPPREAIEMSLHPWFSETVAPESNATFYSQHLGPSEEFLFEGLQEQPILITRYNHEKRICNFVTENRQKGFFSTRALKGRFSENSVCLVRFDGAVQSQEPSRVLSCRQVKDIRPYIGIFYNKISGKLRIRQGSAFGFVDNIYVDRKYITDGISDGTTVTGTSILSFNSKKQEWGWRAISLKVKTAESCLPTKTR